MQKIILILTIIFLYSSVVEKAMADYSFSTVNPVQQPVYSDYYSNSNYPSQVIRHTYSNNVYPQCQYPYGYQYGYGYNPYANPYSLINSGVLGLTNNGAKGQIIRNIGQNILYSLMNR